MTTLELIHVPSQAPRQLGIDSLPPSSNSSSSSSGSSTLTQRSLPSRPSQSSPCSKPSSLPPRSSTPPPLSRRMEAHVLTLTAMISDKESAWGEYDNAMDLCRRASVSQSPLSSLVFGTDKSPNSNSHVNANLRFKPITGNGHDVVRGRCREDSGTVCSDSSPSPSPRLHAGKPSSIKESVDVGGGGGGSGCPSSLGTPVVFQPRKWLMESPNLSSLKIDCEDESLESIINELEASSRALDDVEEDHQRHLLCQRRDAEFEDADDEEGACLVAEEEDADEVRGCAVAISPTNFVRSSAPYPNAVTTLPFPEYCGESALPPPEEPRFLASSSSFTGSNHHNDSVDFKTSSHSLISLPDPHDPLLSYYFTHFPHIFGPPPPPPCCPYPLPPSIHPPQQSVPTTGYDPQQQQQQNHHAMQYPPPLSQLQEPIVINVPNPDSQLFHSSSSSSSIGLSSSFDLHPLAQPPLPIPHPPLPLPREQAFIAHDVPNPFPYLDDQLQQPQLPPRQGTPMNAGHAHRRPLPPPPPHLPMPPPHAMSRPPGIFPGPPAQSAFFDAAGNLIVTPVSTPAPMVFTATTPMEQIQFMNPHAPPGAVFTTTAGGQIVCATNEPVLLPQFHPLPTEMTRLVQPAPPPAMQPPFVVSMNLPQQQAMPCPPVMTASPAPNAPQPPPPGAGAPTLMMAQPAPLVPIQAVPQPQVVGNAPLLFNPVQMMAVDMPAMPCGASISGSVDPNNHAQPQQLGQTTAAPVVTAQRPGVRPLMDIQDEDKNASKKNAAKAGCVFCRSNGEREREYMGHRLRNPITNLVECPQLRKFVCPICGATGDAAHTVSYCPSNNKWTGSTVKHLKAMRSSAGKKCGRNVAKTIE